MHLISWQSHGGPAADASAPQKGVQGLLHMLERQLSAYIIKLCRLCLQQPQSSPSGTTTVSLDLACHAPASALVLDCFTVTSSLAQFLH